MTQTIALVLAAIGGAFVHAALMAKGVPLVPPPDAVIYELTVAFIAFVNAGLFALNSGFRGQEGAVRG